MARAAKYVRHASCLLIAAAAAGLGGCAVGPAFHRPAVPAGEHYRSAGEQVRDEHASTGVHREHAAVGLGASGPWWQLFRSPQLDVLVRTALEDNHDVAAAQAALEQSRAGVTVGGAGRYPQIGFNAGAGRQKYGAEFLGPDAFAPFSYVAGGISVAYQLDYLGAVRHSVQEARAAEQYQRSELAATRLMLSGQVVAEALDIATARAEIRAVRDLLREDRATLRLVRASVAAGSEPRLDILTAQTQLASDATLLPPRYQRLITARHALAVLLGRAPASWHRPDPRLGEVHLPARVPVALPSVLLKRRPDILAAEAQLRAATAALDIATANLYPQITLSATLSEEALRPQHLFDASSLAWSLISGLTAPLYEGGKLHAERRAALDALHERAQLYQQVVISAFGQVADALDALRHDAQLRAAQHRALALSRRRVRLERASYQAGNSGLLPVLDAQRQRERAKLGLLAAEHRQYLDTVTLMLAAGGRVAAAASAPAVTVRRGSGRRIAPGS
ncbi:MAG: efflux transporter outer membrane subunit [Steroidobacteraceae bacterium]